MFSLSLFLVSCITHRELITALGTAARKHLSAIFGGHTGAETVLIDALALGGLERSFHRQFYLARPWSGPIIIKTERKGNHSSADGQVFGSKLLSGADFIFTPSPERGYFILLFLLVLWLGWLVLPEVLRLL